MIPQPAELLINWQSLPGADDGPPLETQVPRCTGRGVEVNERVLLTFAYALGLFADSRQARAMAEAITRLHDHKGDLIVALRLPLSPTARVALTRAWRDVAGEVNVILTEAGSAEWQSWVGWDAD